MLMTKQCGGFTLIELIIAVAVIGILSAIAYPSYQNHLSKSRRTDGMAALMKEAVLQERYAVQNNGCYSSAALGGSTSANGYYDMSVSSNNCDSYTLTATATGVQSSDSDCSILTLDNLGNKTPDSGCW
jgi:type IV pilus assembly protein PilE